MTRNAAKIPSEHATLTLVYLLLLLLLTLCSVGEVGHPGQVLEAQSLALGYEVRPLPITDLLVCLRCNENKKRTMLKI